MSDIETMPLVCLRCKKPIPLSMSTFEEISYTKYSYCENCLHEGIKLLNKPMPTQERYKQKFKRELKNLVKIKCDEINHFVAGADSPFTYQQIGAVQEHLCGIREELGIKVDESEVEG